MSGERSYSNITDLNSLSTKYCSSGGSEIDIVQDRGDKIASYRTRWQDQDRGDKITSYRTRWQDPIVQGFSDGERERKERGQSNVSAK